MSLGDPIYLVTNYGTVTNVDSVLLDANTNRRYLSIINRDSIAVDIAFGTAATAGQCIPLAAAPALGGQGAGYEFTLTGAVDPRAVHAITASGTAHVTVIEGTPPAV